MATMLTASPSPRLTPPAHQSDSVVGFRSPSLRRENLGRATSTKDTSPIVKPHSAHVSAYPLSYQSQSAAVPSHTQPSPSQARHTTAPTATVSNFRPQCPSPTHQPTQLPSVRSIATQTSPSATNMISPPSTSPRPPQVVMVDAQTQYSPLLTSQSTLPLEKFPTEPHTLTPTSNLANLHLTRAESTKPQQQQPPPSSSSASASRPSSTASPHPNKRPLDPVADAAMPAAQTGLTTNKTPSTKEQGQVNTHSSVSNTPQSSFKRDRSAANTTTSASPASDATSQHQQQNGTSHPLYSTQVPMDTSPTPSKKPRPADPEVKVMPLRYETCDTRDLVILISSMLMELIRYNDTIPLSSGSGPDAGTSNLTRFHSRAPPGISVIDYLQRLTTHATLSPPILLSMVYYIDRLASYYPAFTISSLTVHRFLITAATVASKGLSDSFWTNKTYARVGGVSVKELALLELEFLVRVQWRIVPRPETLVDYYKSLVGRSVGYRMEGNANIDNDPSMEIATENDVG